MGLSATRRIASWACHAAPLIVLLLTALPAHAQASPAGPYEASAKGFFALFAIALLLESALHLVFSWRPFITVFDGQTVKPLVSLAVATIVVWTSGLDIAADLVKAYLPGPIDPAFPGRLLTAMVLAGGSSGVNRLMQALGIRPTSAQQNPPPPKVPPTVAWLSVTVRRGAAKGPVTVLLSPGGAEQDAGAFVLGVLPDTAVLSGLLAFLLRRRNRTPPQNGHALPPGTYGIRLVDSTGAPGATTWGPYAIPAGTLLDLELAF